MVAVAERHGAETVNSDRTEAYPFNLLDPLDQTEPCCLAGTILREEFGESLKPMVEADFWGGPISALIEKPGHPHLTLAGHFTPDALELLQFVQTEADTNYMWGDIARIARAGYSL